MQLARADGAAFPPCGRTDIHAAFAPAVARALSLEARATRATQQPGEHVPNRLRRRPAEQLAIRLPEIPFAPIAALCVHGSGEILGNDSQVWRVHADRFGVRVPLQLLALVVAPHA